MKVGLGYSGLVPAQVRILSYAFIFIAKAQKTPKNLKKGRFD